MTSIGFDKPLYILPFDHRGSFQTKMFGWKGALTAEQTAEIAVHHVHAGGGLLRRVHRLLPDRPGWAKSAARMDGASHPPSRHVAPFSLR